jgi:hypothetical protein
MTARVQNRGAITSDRVKTPLRSPIQLAGFDADSDTVETASWELFEMLGCSIGIWTRRSVSRSEARRAADPPRPAVAWPPRRATAKRYDAWLGLRPATAPGRDSPRAPHAGIVMRAAWRTSRSARRQPRGTEERSTSLPPHHYTGRRAEGSLSADARMAAAHHDSG